MSNMADCSQASAEGVMLDMHPPPARSAAGQAAIILATIVAPGPSGSILPSQQAIAHAIAIALILPASPE
jgi:hypothetical protein